MVGLRASIFFLAVSSPQLLKATCRSLPQGVSQHGYLLPHSQQGRDSSKTGVRILYLTPYTESRTFCHFCHILSVEASHRSCHTQGKGVLQGSEHQEAGIVGPPSECVYHRYVGTCNVVGGNRKKLTRAKIRVRRINEFNSYGEGGLLSMQIYIHRDATNPDENLGSIAT